MAKKRLLIIEDDVDVAQMLVEYFISQGYEALNAETGGGGIAIARSKFPNLILLDIMLPDMDGFEVCKSLRTTPLTRHIPITFLTQRDARADKVAGLELGADDYVTKPFDVEELRLRIQGSLRRSSRETLIDIRTGLPTSALVQDMRHALSGRPGWKELDVQLMGLKDFRDMYGFVATDEALAFVGQMFMDAIAKDGTKDDFVGVHSEDKYTLFTFVEDINPFVEALKRRFNDGARTLYNFRDSDRGYMVINEGTPDAYTAPLMHLVVSSLPAPVTAEARTDVQPT
ncbi:MAG TPA: response regulator [Aggregatilineales bacterium]|nr:response regulator [Aggregatilineales bacterium]